MSVLSQGTQVYLVDPATDTVLEVECATNFNPGGNPADALDDTCLADGTASTRPGLRRPGQAALSVNADPRNASHVRLFELSNEDPSPTLHFVVGWSDGVDIAPTGVDSEGDFILPTTRTWYKFDGYVADFPFDFSLNTLVTTAVSIQRTGPAQWIVKTP